MNKVEYITPDYGETYPDDACELIKPVFDSGDEHSLDYCAREAGEDHFANHDGWESSWPMEFELFFNGVSKGVFQVFMEYEPGFSAVKKIELEPTP